MAPRKRMRPNPAGVSSTSLPIAKPSIVATSPAPPLLDTTTAGTSQDTSTSFSTADGINGNTASVNNLATPLKQVRKTRSWYGSWPRVPKSAASTPQLARETIGGTLKPLSTPDFRRFDSRRPTDLSSVFNAGESMASLPNIPEGANKASSAGEQKDGADAASTEQTSSTASKNETGLPSFPEAAESHTPTSPQRPTTSSGWFGWLGASPAPLQGAPPQQDEDPNKPANDATSADPPKEPLPPPPAELQLPATPTPKQPSVLETETPSAAITPWFRFWGATPKQDSEPPDQASTVGTKAADDVNGHDAQMPDAPPAASVSPISSPSSPPPAAGSTWAFWSRDVGSKPASGSTSKPQSLAGELAVIGQGSEAKPEPARGMDVAATPSSKSAKTKGQDDAAASGKKNKRLRPKSMELDESPSTSGASTPLPAQSKSLAPSESAPQESSDGKKQTSATEALAKTLPPNLLLPSFGSTYRLKDNPSIIKQIAQLLLRTQQSPTNHVFRVKETPKVKKAIAIGVHGLFPATYLRPMIGQPTGTSIRLANQCAESIRRWVDAHDCPDCEIEKVALEGEGKIADRVDNLWKLLLNWIEQLRSADLIVLACHSQGVPVAVLLLAKLIDLGIITNAKIGVCAMAGVSLGPFPDYKSSMGMLMGTAAELWEFSNPESDVSKRYETALKEVLEYGVRITYVGSIDDQLVPMESAVYSPASHPYIYRAVFIDGRIHAPDFIAHLVGFALKLRNLGVSDHGLIRELSTPLAGSLYSGEGHSRLYYDDQVYDLAVAHALETTDVAAHSHDRAACQIRHHHHGVARAEGSSTSAASSASGSAAAGPLANPNPYHLPWIMRGLLEEDFVKTELSSETDELLRQFDVWKPVTKALKDVKYRLEAVRSKL